MIHDNAPGARLERSVLLVPASNSGMIEGGGLPASES
jgi:hypothetical protein